MQICEAYKLILNDREAAEKLGVTICELQQSRLTGTLLDAPAPKYIKFTSAVRYKLLDLDEWIEALDENGKEGF